MELEVKGNKFFVLTNKQAKGGEIRLFADMEAPVSRIKELLKKGVEPENIELVSVEIKEEKYLIQSVPWDVIAVKLVKEKSSA